MEKSICDEVIRFISENPSNRLPGSEIPYFDQPLVGFSSAEDQLYAQYKQIIGPFHLSPDELLPGAQTVISWILPINVAVRETNRRQCEWPSREWAETRTFGEALNGQLRRHVVAWLENAGYCAVAPQYSPLWHELPDTPVGIASTWSERHAAYVAGLGTFSLNDGFITPRGIAHRCGSVVTNLSLTASVRQALHHQDNCLYYRLHSCGACIKRCPVGALSPAGHDKSLCRDFVYRTAADKLSGPYNVSHVGCGLCQTNVPCEGMTPLTHIDRSSSVSVR